MDEHSPDRHPLVQNGHGQGEGLVCSPCGKPYKSSTNLTKHRCKDDSVAEASFLCDTCGRTFKRENGFTAHAFREHGKGYGEFRCDSCPKSFARKSTLKRHEKSHGPKSPSWQERTGSGAAGGITGVPKVRLGARNTRTYVDDGAASGGFGAVGGDADSGASVFITTLPPLQCLNCPCDECKLQPKTRPILPHPSYYQRLRDNLPLHPANVGIRPRDK